MTGLTKRTSSASVKCSEKEKLAYLKRREQVRRAQRTHRERKEAYLKSLENEIKEYGTREKEMRQETGRLQSEVKRMKELLSLHGIGTNEDPGGISTSQYLEKSPAPNLCYSISNCSSMDVFEAGAKTPSLISSPPNAVWGVDNFNRLDQPQLGLPLPPNEFPIPDFTMHLDLLAPTHLCTPPEASSWSNVLSGNIGIAAPIIEPTMSTYQLKSPI